MTLICARTEDEIGEMENWACEGFNSGTRYPGMSYEQGVMDALHWLRGDNDHAPHKDE